ncbi:MAG: glutamine-hydrolyzing carbamoyl-phosphate synthase small subunit [Deltaproteobacteria bacterium]|nr:glutamine-hydrolyzing carbamoyl-phosphate synthase small subunit [Deltaproteobacteria bacterium]
MKAVLALADGRVYAGRSFGAEGEAIGEVVFNTSMTGYQEILTDPSYEGQMVAMTYPEIGNVGVNPEDVESRKPYVRGFIVKEYSSIPSNWRATQPLHGYMKEHGIVGIEGIDSRSLVRHLRDHGSQEGIISTLTDNADELIAKAKASPGLVGRDLVKEVTCQERYDWNEGGWELGAGYKKREETEETKKKRRSKTASFQSPLFFVVAYDYGIKFNILRGLAESGCSVKVVPASTSAEEVLALNPDGIFLSNGPGDPDAVPYAKEIVQQLIGKKPIFGICLGHQIMGLALGGRTYKLKFGHHGGNQPVMDLTTRKVEITTQNHGFAVDAESLKGAAKVTHLNLNDNTVEGLAHRELPIFSVQYHPESSPGPHDASYLFRRFVKMMEKQRA